MFSLVVLDITAKTRAVVDFVYTQHRAQHTEELVEPAAWRCPYRSAFRPDHDGRPIYTIITTSSNMIGLSACVINATAAAYGSGHEFFSPAV